MADPTSIPLDQPAVHVDASPGEEILVTGFYVALDEGAVIDGDVTVWSYDSPSNVQGDPGGLLDFEAGGFHVSARDPKTHVIHAVALPREGELAACSELGVASPCLVNRFQKLASSRLLTVAEWRPKLFGPPKGLWLHAPSSALPMPPPRAVPFFAAAALLFVVGLVGMVLTRRKKRLVETPAGQLVALAERVRSKLAGADAVVAAPLAPALEKALAAVRGKRVDAGSAHGKRIASVLARVEAQLDTSEVQRRDDREKQAADELVREVESALEAAEEVKRA